MDAATIKGVVDRLGEKGLVQAAPDKSDRRRRMISLAVPGRELVDRLIPKALEITDATLENLSPQERQILLDLLLRLT